MIAARGTPAGARTFLEMKGTAILDAVKGFVNGVVRQPLI